MENDKWKVLIEACKRYYIDSLPTGLSDAEYDDLEQRAIEEDGFYVRDYVLGKYSKGKKTENHYIEKFKKKKVSGSMQEAINNEGPDDYWDLKYDGCSIAIYPDPISGITKSIVTVGNTNLSSFGVDQTWKLINHVPKKFPKGIVAVQCEALLDLNNLPPSVDPQRARQSCNGYINGKKEEVIENVNNYLTLRAYRYYCADNVDGASLAGLDYKDVLGSFETVYAPDGHITFAPADVFTVQELGAWCENDITKTSTGTFLNDGWVRYSKTGECLGALKFAGAGSTTESLITTRVQGLQWNSQAPKGKDSWSVNVLVEPVDLHGTTIRKPSGSAGKVYKKNITSGAEVSIVLANSTIPMVGEVIKPGSGNYEWPVCSCGYQMSEKDIYGSLLKCGNPLCSERIARMRSVLAAEGLDALDLNKYLAMDRVKWEDLGISIETLLEYVKADSPAEYHDYLESFLTTDLQKRNLDLVCEASYLVLREYVCKE